MKKLFLIALTTVLAMGSLLAQQVTGIVTDAATAEPIPGVNITVQGTSAGAITDLNGEFSINVLGSESVLVFSFIGYLTQEEVVGNLTNIDVQLSEDMVGLEEVVVVGYGTQKKTSLTAAVSSVDAKELESVSVANASNALVGRIPGLISRQTSGAVGQDQTDIYIRGVSTTGNNRPLIIVDGIPRASLNEIAPSSVESYTVLKDAAAVAPYGMAGANGVILITTKSGTESGKPVFTLNSNIGFQNPTIVQDYANSYEFARAFNEAQNNAGVPVEDRRYSAEDIEMYKRSVEGDPSVDPNLYPNQNPYDYMLQPNAPISQTNFSATGGTEMVQYYTGFNYLYQEANYGTEDLNRVGIDTKIDLTPTKKTKISLALNGFKESQKGPSSSGQHVYTSAYAMDPTQDVVYWSDGRIAKTSRGTIFHDIINNGESNTDRTKLLSTLSVEQELFDGLRIKGVFAYDYATNFNKNWSEPASTYYQINKTTDPYTFDEVPSTGKHSLGQSQPTWNSYTGQGIITYNKVIENHSISMLGVAEVRKSDYRAFYAGRTNYELPIDELNFGSADKDNQSNGGSSSEASQLGYVYRLTYNYAEKYLMEVAGRYDGHYYFAPGKKYGFFPAFSLGWRVSEEPFMDGIDQIYNMKLRTSWGQSGNLAGGPNQYSSSLVLYGNSFPFGNSPTQGVYTTSEGNPDITWEKANKFNVGLEIALFEGAVSAEVDYFYETRDNMLLSPAATVPEEYGIGLGQVNAGKMKNNGIEFLLRGNKRFASGLNVGLTGTFTYAHNTLIEIFENPVTADDSIRSRTGKELGAFFGLVDQGLFQVEDDKNGDGIIDAEDGFPEQKLGGIIRPGNIRYVDTNGDGIIDMTDEQRIGYPAIPKMVFSLATNLSWKGFDLNVMFQGAAHASTYIEGPFTNAWGTTGNYAAFLLNNSWTPETPDARFPALSPNGLIQNDYPTHSTFYMLNASYLRLKYAEFGYTLPKAWTDRVSLGSIRLYTSGVNLLTWSEVLDYGIDPEATTHGNSGAGRGWYHPMQRTFTFGINVNF